MLKTLLALVAPLGDVRSTKGKIQIAYKVAQAAFVAWSAFRQHLLDQHPAPPVDERNISRPTESL